MSVFFSPPLCRIFFFFFPKHGEFCRVLRVLERVEDVCCRTRYLYLICYLNAIGAGVTSMDCILLWLGFYNPSSITSGKLFLIFKLLLFTVMEILKSEYIYIYTSMQGAPPLRGGFPVDYGPRADDRRLGLASPVSKTVSHSGNSKGEEDDAQPSRHLWVGNVSQEVSEAILKEKFSQFGEVDNVTVYSSRNYAFVNFINQEDAVEAKNLLHGVMLGGLAMRIEFAKGVSNLPSPF